MKSAPGTGGRKWRARKRENGPRNVLDRNGEGACRGSTHYLEDISASHLAEGRMNLHKE